MFERASRLKLRFDSPQGLLSAEDLWDLPLSSTSTNRANLDAIAIALHRQIKDAGEISFVSEAKGDETLQLRFDIVKHIIGVKLAEKKQAEEARANREKKQRILALIAQKKDEQLAGSSLEELERLAASL